MYLLFRNQIFKTSFIVLFVFWGFSYSISLEYINKIFEDTSKSSRLDNVMLAQTNLLFYPVNKSDTANNAAVQQLHKAFTNLQQNLTTKRTHILSALILINLEHRGDTAAFYKADSLFAKAFKQYPDIRELYWLQGLHHINSGNLFTGIRELDSLRLSGFNNKEFLSDYAQYIFSALTPQKKARTYFLKVVTPASVIADTTTPESISWNIVSGFDKSTSLPSFSYIERYSFKKPYTLMFPEVAKTKAEKPALNMSQALVPSYITQAMIDQLTDRIGKAQCQVNIDLTNTMTPLQEYLANKIYNSYDSVRIVSDLPQYKAFSIRCYARRAWGNSQGMYAGYVAFDRQFRDVFTNPRSKKSKNVREKWETIRYTIAVQSEINVEELTEAKLQSVIDIFR